MSSPVPIEHLPEIADLDDAQKKVRVPKALIVPAKIQKKLDTLEVKLSNTIEANKALKKQIAEMKSANSRVRRIPKVPAADPVAE